MTLILISIFTDKPIDAESADQVSVGWSQQILSVVKLMLYVFLLLGILLSPHTIQHVVC